MDKLVKLSVGPERLKALDAILLEIETRNFRLVKSESITSPLEFVLSIRDLVIKLQSLTYGLLPPKIESKLQAVNLDATSPIRSAMLSAYEALVTLEAVAPFIRDSLVSFRQPPHLPGTHLELLKTRGLKKVHEEFERALASIEKDPAGAIRAAHRSLESLLRVFCEDKKLEVKEKSRIRNLSKIAFNHLDLDPRKQSDKDVRQVLQGLISVVQGISELRNRAAHGEGRKPNLPRARHARLAVQSTQAYIEFFIQAWNNADPTQPNV